MLDFYHRRDCLKCCLFLLSTIPPRGKISSTRPSQSPARILWDQAGPPRKGLLKEAWKTQHLGRDCRKRPAMLRNSEGLFKALKAQKTEGVVERGVELQILVACCFFGSFRRHGLPDVLNDQFGYHNARVPPCSKRSVGSTNFSSPSVHHISRT